jgi:hypothetical protein
MKRNKFSLSHYKLLTVPNMGDLIPISWYEALPGDTIQQRTNLLIRLTPLLAPVMHPVIVRVHSFFCPLRLLWGGFEDFITGGEDGNDTTTWPYRDFNGVTVSESTLYDYLGVPPATYAQTMKISSLPHRMYEKVYNEYYRDQDLVTALTENAGSGSNSDTWTTQKVSWEKDYFTTARPWEQKGSDVTIPIGTTAPITGLGTSSQSPQQTSVSAYETDGTNPTYAKAWNSDSATHHLLAEEGSTGYPNIYADLSAATGISVNDLRLYLALQRYKEARAEYGSRYVEYLQAAFGVRSSDARLQNPEYLGGGRQTVAFSEVLSTADSGNDVVGTMRGHGIAALRTARWRRFFEEHGIVMTLLSVVPKAIYAEGVRKGFHRDDKEEYFQKELAYLGDSPILNKEVYSEHATPEGTFGYQQKYDGDYRQIRSEIAGEFRSSLNHWTYARFFSSDPSLNQTFIECAPTKRQYAENNSDVLYVMANHSVQARRMIPKYPTKRTF